MDKTYDVVVLGAGPAGLTAGLYAARSGLATLILERGVDGGQIANTNDVENYPGQVVGGEPGPQLVARMAQQAEGFGAERATDDIASVELAGPEKVFHGTLGTYRSRAAILATGAHPRPIGCRGEQDFVGRGISFCATCDGPFFRGLDVYVVGGGDAAVEEAIYLTSFARHVTVIHRRDQLRAAKAIQDRAFSNPKVSFLWNSVVDEVGGTDGMLSRLVVRNVRTGELTTIEASPEDGMLGLFGFVGLLPSTGLVEGQVDLDERGYVVAGEDTRTNLPGVFAAGDLRQKGLRQVVTAVADGAVAAHEAYRYLQEA